MQKLIGTNDSANTVSFNVSDSQAVGLLPNDPLDTFIHDEYVAGAVAQMASDGMTDYRFVQVDSGEVCRTGFLAVSLGGANPTISAAAMRGVHTVHVTSTGVGTVLSGLGGGYEGREVTVINVTTNALNTFSFASMAGGSTPPGDRLFVGGLGLALGGGRVFKYHSGVWYAV